MAARYISATYFGYYVGANWRTAAFDESGTFSTTACNTVLEGATAYVQSILRRFDYTIPATGGANADLQLLTFGAAFEMACARPENNLALPEDWESHPAKLMLEEAKRGEAHLSLSKDTAGSEGGVLFSETSTDVSSADGSRSKVFRRDHMDDV